MSVSLMGRRPLCRVVLFLFVGTFCLGTQSLASEADTFIADLSRHVAQSFARKSKSQLKSKASVAAASAWPCDITAGAPPYGYWRATQADIDAEYILLHYRYDAAPTPLPKSILFVWKRDGTYAPWFVYASSEKILDPHVNSYGNVAFFRSPPDGTTPQGPDELVYCPQDPTPGALNSQITAYPCALNPGAAIVVDSIPYNQVMPFTGGAAPDGKFYDLDWAGDRLIYTRSKLTTNQATLNNWDSLLQTNSVIDQVFYSNWTPNDLWLTNVDRDGSIGYVVVNLNMSGLLSGSPLAYMEYLGAYPSAPAMFNQFTTLGVGLGIPYYHRETLAGTGFNSLASNGFVKMGTERQGLHRLKPVAATPTSPGVNTGDLYARSSEDGYAQDHLVAQAPSPNAALMRPNRAYIPALGGDALVAQTGGTGVQSRIEVYAYLSNPGFVGSYVHVQSVAPVLGYPNLALHAVSDDPWNHGILGVMFNSQVSDGMIVLIQCQ